MRRIKRDTIKIRNNPEFMTVGETKEAAAQFHNCLVEFDRMVKASVESETFNEAEYRNACEAFVNRTFLQFYENYET